MYKKQEQMRQNESTGAFRRAMTHNPQSSEISLARTMKALDMKPRFEYVQNSDVLTEFIAMDCEMVGVGFNGIYCMLARVSIVNKHGDCIYDEFVKPYFEVINYRTKVSGVRPEDLTNGKDFTVVQKEVGELIKGRNLVGHSVKNDLKAMFWCHPKKKIRDTSQYKPFVQIANGRTPSLKFLAKEILSIDIQQGEHSSVEDARAAMRIYCTVAEEWEAKTMRKRNKKKI